jgi:hypothetical protein
MSKAKIAMICAALVLVYEGWHVQWGSAARVPLTTEAYLSTVSVERFERRGTDYTNERYNPTRIGKPLDQIDVTYDYDFSRLAELSERLRPVERRPVLRAIFEQVTAGALSETDKELRLLAFLHKASFHNIYLQPMYPDGQTVFDPLVLLELGEMRCGQVARIASDLYQVAGYQARLVQAGSHVSAEVYYEGSWHLFEGDLSGGGQIVLIDGRIPSVAELSASPFLIDKLPSRMEILIQAAPNDRLESKIYPSYYFFSKSAYEGTKPLLYIKTATAEQASASKWYGWNYYQTIEDPERKIQDFAPYYEPGAPRLLDLKIRDGKVTISWAASDDKDGDLLGYRVFIGSHSRGWDYTTFTGSDSARRYWHGGGWKPEMYDALFKEPPSDVAQIATTETSVTFDLPAGEERDVSVMPFDAHGESVGRKLYAISEELTVP